MARSRQNTDNAATQGEATASTGAGKKTVKTRTPMDIHLPFGMKLNDKDNRLFQECLKTMNDERGEIRIWFTS